MGRGKPCKRTSVDSLIDNKSIYHAQYRRRIPSPTSLAANAPIQKETCCFDSWICWRDIVNVCSEATALIAARNESRLVTMGHFEAVIDKVIEQCWQYERMIRGWRCEHYQWDMDISIIGVVEVMIC
ncbi:hypothetical protein Csa_010979 [Cucumis sativus]|nr:hypothetical protein Csa_010979 [Cucumis sativus]